MKHNISNFFKVTLMCVMLSLSCVMFSACNLEDLFVFGGMTEDDIDIEGVESFAGTKNAIFFALYNYYGYEGQHFTNKWLGMNDALAKHGITVTGYEGQQDARKFKIVREPDCDLPEDTVIYMVNNQNWDAGIQFNKPFAQHHPMVVISTCNGVEFASTPILSQKDKISNATIGGLSDYYRKAFENGTLTYLVAKYSAHILPIFAASVDAVDNGKAMRNADGSALHLSISTWAIQTLAEFDEMLAVDSIDAAHPTLRKINVDKFFDPNSDSYGAEKLTEWVSNSTKENIKELYALNGTNEAEDKASYRQGRQLKCGIIAPSSLNDQVSKYVEFLNDYLGTAYNVVFINGVVESKTPQDVVATQLCNQGVDFVISLQDDTNRNKAAQICNDKKVFFAIGGSCQNDIDYAVIKDLPYYVGSIGTSIAEERRSAYEMTEYYLQCLIERDKSIEDLVNFQIQYKGLVVEEEKEEAVAYFKKDEDELWLSSL